MTGRDGWQRPVWPAVVKGGVTYTAGSNGRLYKRLFDWDAALDLYASGMSIAAVAAAVGGTPSGVYRILSPERKQRMDDVSRASVTAGVCERCGKTGITSASHRAALQRSRPDLDNWDGRVLCQPCRGRANRKKLRLTAEGVLTLECGHCHESKPLDDFSPRVHRALMAGNALHQTASCRACQTAARRAYRNRHKIPCARCGKPRLDPKETGGKQRGLADSGLCFTCWHDFRREARLTVAS